MIIAILNPHSIVDLITNSSTEIFVIKKDNEMLQDFINGILDNWQVVDNADITVYNDLYEESNDIWCASEILHKLKESNLTTNDVIIFECDAHAFFLPFVEKYFNVIFKQHD